MAYNRKAEQEAGFKRFRTDLKNGNLPNILMFYGAERLQIRWAVNALADQYVSEATKALDFQILGEEATAEDIMEAADTFSMFSEKRVVWIRNFRPLKSDGGKGWSGGAVQRLIDFLQEGLEGTILIFSNEEVDFGKSSFAKLIKKQKGCYEFDRMDRKGLEGFAEKRIRNLNLSVDRATMAFMIEQTGYFNKDSSYDLYSFDNDIKKVAAHSDGHRIVRADVEAAVAGDLDSYIFDMLDNVSRNNKEKAFFILNNIVQKPEDVFSTIGAIVRQFEFMYTVKEMQMNGSSIVEISKRTKKQDWQVRKMSTFSGKYSQSKIKEILLSIYATDMQIKSGLLNGKLALEMFISAI